MSNKKIDKRFRLKTNFNGDEIYGFNFNLENNRFEGKNCYGETLFIALGHLSNQNPNNLSTNEDYTNLINGFIKWFDENIHEYKDISNQIGSDNDFGHHPQELIEDNKYEEWANVMFNWLKSNTYIYPIPLKHFTLNLCWTGAVGIDFRGRNAFEILESFAINHRKKACDIEAHRNGLKKFLYNFERDMGRYFGFYGGGNNSFLEFLLSTNVFRPLER